MFHYYDLRYIVYIGYIVLGYSFLFFFRVLVATRLYGKLLYYF